MRSNGVLNTTAKTIANEPAILMSLARTGMNSLSKRLGEIRFNLACHQAGAWVRNIARRLTIDDRIETSVNIYGVEAGYDFKLEGNRYYASYFGVMAGFMSARDMKTKGTNSQYAGTGSGVAPSVGVYGTYVNKDGYFVDATIRGFAEDIKINSYSSSGDRVYYSPDRKMLMASLEAGRKFDFKASDGASEWSMEPKVELMYGIANSDEYYTSNGGKIHFSSTQSVVLKPAVDIGYKFLTEKGSVVKPYVHFGINKEFDGRTDIEYATARYKSDQSGTGFEIGLGLDAQINDAVAFYSDIVYEKGEVVQSTSANIGVRYTW